MTVSVPPFIRHFSVLAPAYDIVLCDVWGVIHNGVTAFPQACDALTRFRATDGTVVLISNAPRPGDVVAVQLDGLGVPRTSYDGIVTSGDVTRSVVASRVGQSVYHLGPERDLPIFAGLDVRFSAIEAADYVVCSGLFDDTHETAENYRDMLLKMKERGQFMVCANPDVVVERGSELVYCAGAIADLYAALGGDVLYAGKPYPPIYQDALAKAASARAGAFAPDRVLAIGDSVRTDLNGAARLKLDCLFVTAGIHAEELGAGDDPDPAALARIFADAGITPKAVTRRLVW